MLLKEYVGDMSRSLSAVVESLEPSLGHLYRIGGNTRVYAISGTNQQGAIYAITTGQAVGFGWAKPELVDTIYWWETFDFGEPDYCIDLPSGVDVERLVPQIIAAIKTQQLGEIAT